MKVIKGFVAVLALGVLGLSPAFGQTGGSVGVVEASPFSPPPGAPGVFSPPPAAATTSAGTASSATPPVQAAPAQPETAAPAATARSSASGALRRAYNSVNVEGRHVALTFDDGPNPETTIKLLDMLKARGVKATFFVLGSRAAQNPAILRRMVAEGHEVANHTWNHPQMPKISRAAVDKQIEDTSAAIERATGKRPLYIRPPYGAMNNTLRSYIEQKFGLTFIYWSVDPLDWKNRNANTVRERILSQVRPGSIILLHDIHPTTVAAMPQLLDTMIARGYQFATTSEIIAMDRPGAPSVVATNASASPRPARRATAQRPPQHQSSPVHSIGLY